MSVRGRILLAAGALAAATVLTTGCSLEPKRKAIAMTEEARKGPQLAPVRNITNFSDGLRCMDKTLGNYGVKDVSVLVEDLLDNTKKVNAGTRDMLISAVSDMTKRSRAVRLVTFSADAQNLVDFFKFANSFEAYSELPQYDIRGSVSQLDEIAKNQFEAGATFETGDSGIGGGVAKSAGTTILGLDLSVIYARDYSLVPGVTSRNSVIIIKEGFGVDAEAQLSKFGINFGLTLTKNEGTAQALRTLVELASIELIGKLTKVPYWQCLGAAPDNEAVRSEIEDWYYAMAGSDEMVRYFQTQLGVRGYYVGPVNGQSNEQFRAAVIAYRQALNLPAEPEIDLAFFRAYLAADHDQIAIAAPAPQAAPARAIALDISTDGGQSAFAPGSTLTLTVQPARDAHVYCYIQDDTKRVQRFFPNRFAQDSYVAAARPLRLPGTDQFQLYASERGERETVACFATEREVSSRLVPDSYGVDFEYLPVGSLDEVRDQFVIATEGQVGERFFHIEPK